MAKNKQGFFLIEALLSICLLVIGVLALSEAFQAERRSARAYAAEQEVAECSERKILHGLIGVDIETKCIQVQGEEYGVLIN